jgi:lysophospholipase L1-like esterase
MSWVKRHSSFALFLGSILFSLLLAELFLRLLGIGYGNSPLESSPRLHHIHPANYSYFVHDPAGEYGGYKIYFDREGYRIPDPDIKASSLNPERKIAFLGDSFTEGNEVSWKDSFIGLIQKNNPSVAVRNFGVSSYSPLIYLAQAKKELVEYKPTDVVLQIYSNDFDGDHEYLANANSQDLRQLTAVSGNERKLAIAILRHSYLARLVRKIQLQIDFLIHAPEKPAAFPDEALYFDATAFERRKLTYEAILQIRDQVKNLGANFYLLIIPNKGLSIKGQCCATDRLHQEIAVFAKQNKIQFIDLGKAFGSSKNQRILFFPRDIHLTKEGNAEMASAIAQDLKLSRPQD